MGCYDDLLRNYATHAAQALPPIIRDAAARLSIEDQEQTEALGEALARAYMAGADTGQSEMLAQVAEQGGRFIVEQLRGPENS